jgi:hypothetical protein
LISYDELINSPTTVVPGYNNTDSHFGIKKHVSIVNYELLRDSFPELYANDVSFNIWTIRFVTEWWKDPPELVVVKKKKEIDGGGYERYRLIDGKWTQVDE